MSVGLLCWLGAKLVGLGELVSMHGNQIVDIGNRVVRLETAALAAAQIPGQLAVLDEKLSNVQKSQTRVEAMLEAKLK